MRRVEQQLSSSVRALPFLSPLPLSSVFRFLCNVDFLCYSFGLQQAELYVEWVLTFGIFGLAAKVCWITCILWACYPVVWLFSEGFGSFSVSFEVTMYSLLDVLNKVLFCFIVMGGIDALDDDTAVADDEMA